MLVALALAAGSCGGVDETPSAGGALPAAGGGGTLAYAVPALPSTFDPLEVSSPAQALISRQVHEPLTGNLRGPYGQAKRQPGLALSVRPSVDRRVWTLELREGVSFRDGTPFNAAAVLANSRRWRSTGAVGDLLAELFAVDAPRPHEVRFVLNSSVPDLPRRLASARLGIVSPQGLEPRSGEGARFTGSAGSGTGPFVLGPQAEGALDLTRNASWWGTAVGLGPALDNVAFVAAPSDQARLALLRAGDAQVAAPLRPESLRVAAADPLLGTIEGDGAGVGVAASVRGLVALVQPLSSVWLTTVTD